MSTSHSPHPRLSTTPCAPWSPRVIWERLILKSLHSHCLHFPHSLKWPHTRQMLERSSLTWILTGIRDNSLSLTSVYLNVMSCSPPSGTNPPWGISGPALGYFTFPCFLLSSIPGPGRGVFFLYFLFILFSSLTLAKAYWRTSLFSILQTDCGC